MQGQLILDFTINPNTVRNVTSKGLPMAPCLLLPRRPVIAVPPTPSAFPRQTDFYSLKMESYSILSIASNERGAPAPVFRHFRICLQQGHAQELGLEGYQHLFMRSTTLL
jgi:hypothetical protein